MLPGCDDIRLGHNIRTPVGEVGKGTIFSCGAHGAYGTFVAQSQMAVSARVNLELRFFVLASILQDGGNNIYGETGAVALVTASEITQILGYIPLDAGMWVNFPRLVS